VRDPIAQPVSDYLFVRLRGAVAAVQSAATKMRADAAALGAQVQVMDNAEAWQDWRASGEQTLQFFDAPSPDVCLWRLSVPQTAPVLDVTSLGIQDRFYIEWHGAQRWIWAPLNDAQTVRQVVSEVGGQATLFRRPQQANAASKVSIPALTPLDPVQQRIQQALKNEFDPLGIFSPRRLNAYF
jgi:glycolate oxidase FAD binding subunit